MPSTQLLGIGIFGSCGRYAGYGHVSVAEDDRVHTGIIVFAILAAVAAHAGAFVSAVVQVACAAILARFRMAFVHFGAAVFASESGLAFALVIVEQRLADTSVGARLDFAVVYFLLAVLAGVAEDAMAFVTVDQIHASASVPARVPFAVVYVRGAIPAGEAARAGAFVSFVGRRHRAIATVRAGIRHTVIDCGLAFGSAVARRARAFVSVDGIATNAAMLAGFHFTSLYGYFAMSAVPSFGAFALIIGSILLR